MKPNMRLLSMLCLCLWSLHFPSCSTKNDTRVPGYRVEKADFISSVAVSGELLAEHATTLNAPMIPWNLGSLKITRLVEDGAEVDSGTVLVEFDKGEVQKAMEDAQSELEIATAEYRKTETNQQAQIYDLEVELEKAGIQLQRASLNNELAGYKPQIEQKRGELQWQNAAVTRENARKKLRNQKNINLQELGKLNLKIDQARNKLQESEQTLQRLVISAPAPGIVILRRNWSTGDKIQIEDQVWRGQDLIRLPDLHRMQSLVEINEVDVSKIDTGLTARITLDAYPDTSFNGKVVSVAALAHEKSRNSGIKVFDVRLAITGENEKLVPGMTVRCEIETNRLQDTLFVPLDAIYQSGNQAIVYLVGNGGTEIRPVTTGLQNDNYIVIRSGLHAGDAILLNPPPEYGDKAAETD